ncbi:MAG TPA: serine hydrolase [Puia sp.]|nr:serine hydrolase [Puia sp.]
MAFKGSPFVLSALFLVFSVYTSAQTSTEVLLGSSASFPRKVVPLPRSTPEREGVSSNGIAGFLDAIAASPKDEFHSFMFLRHGKVIAEGWWDPYRPDLKHTLYSVSKSFTSSAIGFAVSEGLMKVSDKVVSFFPGDLPDSISSNLAALTVKDLLDMSEGQEPEPTGPVISADSNWVRSFLAIPIVHKPGTQFLYNSLGVYVLSAIVQKVTGQKTVDYLTPRLFQPLGIDGADWEISPQHINVGGWGLRLKTEDLARVGQLYLKKGNWNGKQVLPAEWVEEATSVSIIQTPDPKSHTPKDSSDWLQGYGYLFWRCRQKNIYRADGAFGQYIIVMPDQDAVLAITSETPDMQDELNLVWKYILPSIQKDPLPADQKAESELRKKSSSLALKLPPATADAAIATTISGKTFDMEPSTAPIKGISFLFHGKGCTVTMTTDAATHRMAFGSGKWEEGLTTLPGPHLTSRARASMTGLPPFEVAGSYRWIDESTVELVLRYIESPHTETITCHFDQNKLSASVQNSFDFGKKTTVLNGVIH